MSRFKFEAAPIPGVQGSAVNDAEPKAPARKGWADSRSAISSPRLVGAASSTGATTAVSTASPAAFAPLSAVPALPALRIGSAPKGETAAPWWLAGLVALAAAGAVGGVWIGLRKMRERAEGR